MILTLIINTYCLTLCLPLFALRTGNCCRSRYCSTASRKIADRETLRQPRSLFSRLIASSDKWRKTVFIAITTTLHILLINVCAKITPENHLKKRIFACCFVFCEVFSRNNKSVAVVSFITQKWFSYRPGWVMDAMNILYSGMFIFWLDLYLHNLNGVPEKCQHPNSTRI